MVPSFTKVLSTLEDDFERCIFMVESNWKYQLTLYGNQDKMDSLPMINYKSASMNRMDI